MRTASVDQINNMLSSGDFHEVEAPIMPRTVPAGNGHQFDLLDFLSRHGIQHHTGEPYQGGTKYVLENCPFDQSHTGKDAAVFQRADGSLGFKCLHNSCSGNHWREFRQRFEPTAYDRQNQPSVNLSSFMADPAAPASAPAAGAPAPTPPRTFRQLAAQHTALRDPIIHGLLRRGETMNIIAPPKTGKSWLVNQLAIYGCTGGYWHGHLVERGNVLILDNELHPETSADRIPRVASAMQAREADYMDSLFVENLRGKSWDVFKVGEYLSQFQPRNFNIVILDAFYGFMPAGMSENDNASMTEICNALDRYAAMLDCAFVAIHHTSKGNQSGKSVTDTGSGAGAQSRAVDTHLVLRPHADPSAVVMEAVTRSWPSPDPVCLRWDFPLWRMDEQLDPSQLKQEKPGRQAAGEKPSKFEAQRQQILEALAMGGKTKTRLKAMLNTNGTIVNDLLDSLAEDGLIVAKDITTNGGKAALFELRGEG